MPSAISLHVLAFPLCHGLFTYYADIHKITEQQTLSASFMVENNTQLAYHLD